MNELTIKNKELLIATNKVLKLTTSIRNNAFEIAHIIAEVNDNELYKQDGFESVHAWTEFAFGYKKTTSYNLLKIGHEYTRAMADGKRFDCNLLPEDAGTNFTTSQVEALLSLDKPVVEGLVADGQIVPEMTVRDIKAVVKAKKESEKPEPECVVDDSERLENDEPDSMIDDELIEVIDEHRNIYRIPAHILFPYIVKE